VIDVRRPLRPHPGSSDCHPPYRREYADGTRRRSGGALVSPAPGRLSSRRWQSLPKAWRRLRRRAQALLGARLSVPFNPDMKPHILEGLAEASGWASPPSSLHDVQEAPKRMVSDESSPKRWTSSGASGASASFHCEETEHPLLPGGQAIAEGRTAPTDFPATCGWTERKRSTAPS